MTWRLFLAALIAVVAGPVAAADPKTCSGAAPLGFDYREYQAREWPPEAERARGDAPNVVRQDDRLQLAIDGGTFVELRDCLDGDASHSYLYDRFDDPGRFYVVRRPAPEDFSYTLVLKRTGQQFTVYGSPIWSTDKTRFIAVACSASPDRGVLQVYAAPGDSLALEAEIPLPCATHSCSARWDLQSWISVGCVPHLDPGKKPTDFVVIRSSDGSWKKFGR